MLANFHHVAFRCNDAEETVRFYTEVCGLKFSHAVTNDIVGSTREYSPHIHIFLELDDGSCIAFFEVPLSPPAIPDVNTPAWVEHVAFRVNNMEDLLACKKRLEDHRVEFIGPVNHYAEQYSIYFFDPNGIRLEFNLPARTDAEQRATEAPTILAQWAKRKSSEFTEKRALA